MYKVYSIDKRVGIYVEQYFKTFGEALNDAYHRIDYEGFPYVCIYNPDGEKIYSIRDKKGEKENEKRRNH